MSLIKSPENFSAPLHVIFLDQPIARIVDFAKISLSDVNALSFLLGPASINEKSSIARATKAADLQLVLSYIDNDKEASEKIKEVLSSNFPVVAVPDNLVFSPRNAKWLLYMAYQRRIPVIGFSSAFVRAGAIAAIFSSPQQILRQGGEIFSNFEASSSTRLIVEHDPKYYSVEFNSAVYRSLRKNLPSESDVLRKLDERR